jgi:hypothetical protein
MTNGGDSKKLRSPRIGSLPQATVVANSYIRAFFVARIVSSRCGYHPVAFFHTTRF